MPENILVVFDEAYFEFVDRKDFPRSLEYLKKGKNVIILRTFSKIYGLAGLRIGYGIAKKEFIQYLERCRQPFNVNLLAQEAAQAALSDADFVKKSRKIAAEGKEYLYQSLEKMGIEYIPSATNFILLNLKRDGIEVFRKLLKKGVIIRDMRQYGLKDFIRVTVGLKEENVRFVKAFKEVWQN